VAVHRLANELAKNENDEVAVFSLSPPPADATYQHSQIFEDARALLQGHATRLSILPLPLNVVRFEDFDVVHPHGDDWFYVRRTTPTVHTLHASALREARSAASYKRKLVQYSVYPLEHVSATLATIPLAVGTDAAAIYGLTRSWIVRLICNYFRRAIRRLRLISCLSGPGKVGGAGGFFLTCSLTKCCPRSRVQSYIC
jgi:hypothetical protein